MVVASPGFAIYEIWINPFATKFDDEALQDVHLVAIEDDCHM